MLIIAANEKEVLLLELFPMVAKTFLTDMKVKAYAAAKPAEPKAEEKKAEEVKKIVIMTRIRQSSKHFRHSE